MQTTRILKVSVIAAAVGTLLSMHANAKEKVFVGHLADYSGPTAAVGKHYADGIKDTLSWLNKNGGIDGTELEFESVDYAYKVPQAISNYKKWTSRKNMVAMQGWGTADTEALISFAAKDKVAVFSASYSGHLTDPTGKNPKTKKPAPYNFFYGASYSDTCRALVQWAKSDWEQQGKSGKPGFVHIGDNHPYPNAPKKACAEYAEELGFDVKPPVVVSMKPGDFKAQCLSIKTNGANYGYVANLGGSIVSLIKSCDTVGTDIQLMSNIWGGDKLTFDAVGEGIDNYVFPAMTPFWTDNVPALENVRKLPVTAIVTTVSRLITISEVSAPLSTWLKPCTGPRIMAESRVKMSSTVCMRKRTGYRKAWKASACQRTGPVTIIEASIPSTSIRPSGLATV